MNSIQRMMIPCLIAGTAVLMLPAHASEADGQRDVSIYDQDPSCLERGELKPGQVPRCVEFNGSGPAVRRVLPNQPGGTAGATGSTGGGTSGSTSGTGGSTQNGGTFNSSVNGQPQNGGTFTGSASAQSGGTTAQGSGSASMRR